MFDGVGDEVLDFWDGWAETRAVLGRGVDGDGEDVGGADEFCCC